MAEDSTPDNITHYDSVEAYAGKLSYEPGEQVTIHVSCAADRYDIEIARWGGRREVVWSAHDQLGSVQPTPSDADASGCGWSATHTIVVPTEWQSGFYQVALRAQGVADDRASGHAGFVVRAAGTARRRALLVLATNTYNAYNNWGGRSLYTGGKQVSFRRPFGRGMIHRPETDRDDRKARPVRWGEDPDPDGTIYQQYRHGLGYPGYMGSAGWFTYERRFVEWAERDGFAFDYAISADLEHGETTDAAATGTATDTSTILDGYDVVIGVGHDEYWSAAQRETVEAFVLGGGNYVSISGNTMFWQVRLTDDGDSMICHKYSAHETDPVVAEGRPTEMTGMWADPLVSRPEAGFLGAGSAWGLYSRFGAAMPRGSGAFTVYRDTHWMFDGTGLRYGDLLGATHGVVGYETVGCRLTFDEYQLPIAAGGDGTPADVEIVAFTPSSNLAMGEYPASIAALDDQGDLEFVAGRLFGRVDDDSLARIRHGNAVMLVCRPFGAGGGEVVTIGSTDWVFGLAEDEAVAQVTRNVLRRYP